MASNLNTILQLQLLSLLRKIWLEYANNLTHFIFLTRHIKKVTNWGLIFVGNIHRWIIYSVLLAANTVGKVHLFDASKTKMQREIWQVICMMIWIAWNLSIFLFIRLLKAETCGPLPTPTLLATRRSFPCDFGASSWTLQFWSFREGRYYRRYYQRFLLLFN